MAEDKDKKNTGLDLDEMVILVIILISLLAMIIPLILGYITSGQTTLYGFKFSALFNFFINNAFWFKLMGFLIAGVAAIYAFYFKRKADAIVAVAKAKVYPHTNFEEISVGVYPTVSNPLQEKWGNIKKLADSQNPSDWRLAIIEADIILSDLLDKLQLPGDTMGEKLKAVEKSDFITLDAAWEAHKFRNSIAHEGSDFLINEREIHRVISLYESVFKEFELI